MNLDNPISPIGEPSTTVKTAIDEAREVGQKQYLHKGYRIVFALLTFAAVVTEIATIVERGRWNPGNFFSFFTMESNLFAAAIFLLSALAITQGRQSMGWGLLRGAATLYMAITGIVFSLLLAPLEGVEFTAVPWDNLVLHYIMPIAVVLYWFVDVPKVRITFKQALIWLVFPIVYVLYSLIRGPIVNWYPYPFLNPSGHGYGGVAGTTIALVIFAAGLIWVLTRFTRRDTTGGTA